VLHDGSDSLSDEELDEVWARKMRNSAESPKFPIEDNEEEQKSSTNKESSFLSRSIAAIKSGLIAITDSGNNNQSDDDSDSDGGWFSKKSASKSSLSVPAQKSATDYSKLSRMIDIQEGKKAAAQRRAERSRRNEELSRQEREMFDVLNLRVLLTKASWRFQVTEELVPLYITLTNFSPASDIETNTKAVHNLHSLCLDKRIGKVVIVSHFLPPHKPLMHSEEGFFKDARRHIVNLPMGKVVAVQLNDVKPRARRGNLRISLAAFETDDPGLFHSNVGLLRPMGHDAEEGSSLTRGELECQLRNFPEFRAHPFAATVCHYCGKRAERAKFFSCCQRCKSSWYCSVGCQKLAWDQFHQTYCDWKQLLLEPRMPRAVREYSQSSMTSRYEAQRSLLSS